MGHKILLYYKYVKDQVGFQGKIQLAQKTKMPSTIAATAVDDPETLKKFRKAIEEITGKPAPVL